jgi:predicted DNA-binding transcriptional regulator AlpA
MANGYIKTKVEFADVAQVSRPTVYQWELRPDFPKKVKGKGWDRREVQEYAKQRLEEAKERQQGAHSDLKAVKIQKQIDRLDRDIQKADLDIAKKRGELISVEEHNQELADLSAIFCSVYDQDVDDVANLLKDARLLKRFKERRHSVRTRLIELVQAVEPKPKKGKKK